MLRKMTNNGLTKLLTLLIFSINCNQVKDRGISLYFYRSTDGKHNVLVEKIETTEIEAVNWREQKFRILNKIKKERIDSVFFRYSAINSFVNVCYNGTSIYNASIVPMSCFPTIHNWHEPYVFINEKNSLFNDSSEIIFNYNHREMDPKIINKINNVDEGIKNTRN